MLEIGPNLLDLLKYSIGTVFVVFFLILLYKYMTGE